MAQYAGQHLKVGTALVVLAACACSVGQIVVDNETYDAVDTKAGPSAQTLSVPRTGASTATQDPSNTLPLPTPGQSLSPTPVATATATPASTPTPTPTPTPWGLLPSAWLHTQGNHIYDSNNQVWMGRGVNLYDTRACDGCTYQTPNQAEVERRIDAITDVWGATFIRLDLDNFTPANNRVQYDSVIHDAGYLADIEATVAYVATKPHVYIMVSLSVDEIGSGSDIYNDGQVPSPTTAQEWSVLSRTLLKYPNVIFGIGNEPNANDDVIYSGMKQSVVAVRAVEDAAHAPHHLIAVQGSGWSRDPSLYVSRPTLTDNLVYESHPYDPVADQLTYFWNHTQQLPMIVGEFGFWYGRMTLYDATYLMHQAELQQVPWSAWSFHHSCGTAELQLLLPPNSTDTCGINAPLNPTPWGQVVRTALRATAPRADITASNPPPGSLALAVQPNLCMTMPQASGRTPTLATCAGSTAQRWTWSGSTLTASGACLTASATNAANGSALTSAACTAANTQQWVWYGTYLQLKNTGKCINLATTTPASGAQLTLNDCQCTSLATTNTAANTQCASPTNPFTQAWQAY